MDVLLDTNAIRAAGLDGPALKSLRDYLERTNSSLLLPEVVLEELVAQRRVSLRKVERQLRAAFETLKRLAPGTPGEPPDIDVDANVAQHRSFLSTIASSVEVLPNEPGHLTELVSRLANRVPPASQAGEEARDVLIWLAALARLKHAPLALVSTDKAFVGPSGDLRRGLQAELGDLPHKLLFFSDLDRFLAEHHAKVSFVTAEWLRAEVDSEMTLNALDDYLDNHLEVLHRQIDEYGEPTGYQRPIQLVQHDVTDFFVADLPGEELYVATTVSTEVEIDVEYWERYEDNWGNKELGDAVSHCIYPTLTIQLQLEVAERAVKRVAVTAVKHA